MYEKNIPLCIPNIGEEEINGVIEVLKSGWLAHGPKNKEFEKNFAKYIGVKHAISTNSCTSALELAIKGKELKGEIIVPSFTFVASANSIVNSGCKPIFVDVEFNSCNIDISKIKEKISDKTVGIMPVHFAGQACKMDELKELAEEKELVLIEDSAEAIGAKFKNKKTGSYGVGCFSFFPTKNITTGEGGMLTTNDDEFAEKVRALKAHGIKSTTFEREKIEKPWFRSASFTGHNYRLCDVLAAIGLEQLKKVDKMNELRRKHSTYLNENLKELEGKIYLPFEEENCKHVYQMYTIKLNEKINRENFVKSLRKEGIQASVHFDPPVHLQEYYLNSGWKKEDLKVTEKISNSIVSLPMFPQLKKEELNHIVTSIENLIN